ncbi:saccharopine dehydrogenase NADP-binding domain-containing protein [Chitinophaga oryzae]|uniref:Saccharopine dehydrogenase NADP-binding domain-containing protein n=1 Tax=Chitinophaga oryzae TaxID=2725414 RepID=A0AAE6ZDQ2_9BACT|nr:saccharopine dehydrogenase C-terminal domain-containing protein [Chitinophaga oryzae]QJB31028.1 saccharopine dehydrogenase NADP-binding domain-containing protein [Chitinophaga oryzae]QJB37513.1 saccharopine dehydrogenase NADP-binding domain-containing protein [Chitinophaga oryzae]
MKRVMIIGAGKIGETAAFLLQQSGDYQVTLADANQALLDKCTDGNIRKAKLDVNDAAALETALTEQDMVLSACPFFLNVKIAAAAAKAKTHYFDLTEDVATTNAIREIAQNAEVSFMPQCGLAPGFISIAAYDIAKQFDTLDSVKLRVGALPQFPTNSLMYNLTWSTDGLINEYCNPCDAIYEGERKEVMPLEGYERFALDGIEYEAFNTSGGLSALAEILDGKVYNLDYKTVRYPGHCQLMKILLNELKLNKKRDVLKDIMEDSIPFTPQDVVLVFVSVSGTVNGRSVQRSYSRKIYNQEVGGKDFTAIQLTTAGAACAVIDLHAKGLLPGNGFVKQEDVIFKDLISNRFAQYYN